MSDTSLPKSRRFGALASPKLTLAALSFWMLCGVAAPLTPGLAAEKPPAGGTVRDEVGVNIHFTHPLPDERGIIHHPGVGAIPIDISWGDIEKQNSSSRTEAGRSEHL